MMDEKPPLSVPHVQSALLSEAIRHAEVGFLVWDDDRRYVAANDKACELLACTIEELVGSTVGSRTDDGGAAVEQVVRAHGGQGKLTVTRFDGRELRIGYISCGTRIAGVPYLASIIWPLSAVGRARSGSLEGEHQPA
jgi:PAS domain-containing protein